MKVSGNELIKYIYSKGYRATAEGNIVSPFTGNKRKLELSQGYYHLAMRDWTGQKNKVSVHRFVAYQLYGDIIFQADCVRHLDGNKLNNSFNNIAIGTVMDNWKDIPKKERYEHVAFNNMKYSVEEVLDMRDMRNRGASYAEIMDKYNISSKGTMSHIINKRITNIDTYIKNIK